MAIIDPGSVYGELLGRLLSAGEILWEQRQDSDVRTWVRFWAIGLGFLGPASSEAQDAGAALQESTGLAEGSLTDPAREAVLRIFRTNEVEQYHELCLIALSQPLLEALATTYLDSPREPAGYRPGDRVPLRWREMLQQLEANPSPSTKLLEAARLVEVTLGTGRNRLIAHVAPGSLSVGPLRDADGSKRWSGRIFLDHGPAKEQALVILNELNAQLAFEERCEESNIYELGRKLLLKAGRMPVAWGDRLQSVAVAAGFQLDFVAGATRLVELVEAVAAADPHARIAASGQ